jgi:hypothetical protein
MGMAVGLEDGLFAGCLDGWLVGDGTGIKVGLYDGLVDGRRVGALDGWAVGTRVGCRVG